MPQGTCELDSCERPVKYRGWCIRHYKRWLRNGTPESRATIEGEPLAWLHGIIADPSSEACIEWPFGRDRKGYGKILYEGKHMRASHAALILSGSARTDVCALHSCDNPPCVNPQHLRWGTMADNARDAVSRDRHTRGERHADHILNDQTVLHLRGLDYSILGSITETAREYGVSRTCLSDIIHGRTWKHLLP